MRSVHTTTVCVALLIGCSTTRQHYPPELVGPHCDLKSPPASAKTTQVHGTALSAFPAKPERSFTGCQSIWAMADGKVFWQSTVQFTDGRPKLYRYMDYVAGTRELLCRYEGERVEQVETAGGGVEQACPSAETLQLAE